MNLPVETCSICLNDMIDETSICRKYKCNHYFHKNCIHDWTGNCPLCRAIVKPQNFSLNWRTKYDNIKGFKSLPNDVPSEYINIYLEKWLNNECIKNNHKMFFKHTYGVIGICETCQIIQTFNLSHPSYYLFSSMGTL